MVTVPRIRGQRIAERPLPGPPAPAALPIEAFGGGQAVREVFRQTQVGMVQAREFFAKEMARARRIEAADSVNQFNEGFGEIQFRFNQLKGDQPLRSIPEFSEELETLQSEIEKEIVDEATRELFRVDSDRIRIGFEASMRTHAAKQMAIREGEVRKSSSDINLSTAVRSFDDQLTFLEIFERELRDREEFAKDNNIPDEVMQAEFEGWLSKVQRGRLSMYLSNHRYFEAEEELERVKGDLKPDDLRVMTNAVKTGAFTGKVRLKTGEILAMNLDERESKVEANKIEDPALQKSVNQSLRIEFSERRRLEKQAQNERFTQWTTVMNRPENQGRPPEDVLIDHGWLTAPESLQQSLKIKLNPPSKNDNQKYLDLLDKSRTKKGQDEIKSWDSLRFNEETKGLDASHRGRIEKIWTSPDIQQDVFLTKEQDKVATRFLIENGFFPASGSVNDATEQQRQIKEDFVVALEKKISDEQLQKKQVNSKVIQAFGDELMADTVEIRRNANWDFLFFSNFRWAWQSEFVEKPRFAVPALVDEPSDILGLNAQVTSIPTQERRGIEEDFRSRATVTRVTDEMVMRAFRILVQGRPGWRQEYTELTGKRPE